MKKVYLDFNAYINALINDEFKELLLSKKNDFEFYFSYALAEELHRNEDNEKFKDKIGFMISFISQLTDDNQIGTNYSEYVCSRERSFKDEYKRCSLSNTDDLVNSQGKLDEVAANMIINISSDEKKKNKGLDYKKIWEIDSVKKLLESYSVTNVSNSYEFNINNLGHLCNILCAVGYSEEKNTHTYVSGVYDVTHLIYSSQMDYFITSDKECYRKARAIFEFIGSNCKPILLPNPSKAKKENYEKVINELN